MLAQLAQPTLYNINIFNGDRWWGYPAVAMAGAMLVVAIAGGVYLTVNWRKGPWLLTVLGLAWLPFGIGFFYHTAATIGADARRLAQKPDDSVNQSLCQMDKSQRLGGVYCLMTEFWLEAKKVIPAGAKVKVMYSPAVAIYPNYYLYPDYYLVNDIAEADYLLIFFTTENLFLSAKGELSERIGAGKPVSYGHWRKLGDYSDNIFILKRL